MSDTMRGTPYPPTKYYWHGAIADNRRAVIEALKTADDANRATGTAEYNGKQCACMVAWRALGGEVDDFSYDELSFKVDFDYRQIYRLNDQRVGDDEEAGVVISDIVDPDEMIRLKRSFYQIGDYLDDLWFI